MELGRCVRLFVPFAILAAMAAASPLAPPGGAGVRAPVGTCSAGTAAPVAAVAQTAWYRLDPVLDGGGTLAAMRLAAGVASGPTFRVDVPAESFASGPVGGRILVGEDDGVRSRLRLLDTARGCWSLVGLESAVVRSAVMGADASVIYEHRVDRASRADLGVWRRHVASGQTKRVLEPIARDDGYGPTFTTEVTEAGDGRVIATSCGVRACRSRVLEVATGQVTMVPGIGPVIGLAGDRLIAMGICDALPCHVEAIDLRTDARTRVTDGVTAAALGGSVLVWTDAGGSVWETRLDAGPGVSARTVAAPGLTPIRGASLASSGAAAVSGAVVLAPGGRIGDPSLLQVLDPASVHLSRFGEVVP